MPTMMATALAWHRGRAAVRAYSPRRVKVVNATASTEHGAEWDTSATTARCPHQPTNPGAERQQIRARRQPATANARWVSRRSIQCCLSTISCSRIVSSQCRHRTQYCRPGEYPRRRRKALKAAASGPELPRTDMATHREPVAAGNYLVSGIGTCRPDGTFMLDVGEG